MKTIKGFLSNIVTLILLLAMGVGVVWFISRQTQQPVAQEQPKPTGVSEKPTPPPAEKPTPEPTRIITVIPVIVTTFPTPTPAPSPTATPTFEPLSDKPIMGFVFKPPQVISDTRQIPEIEIVDWLSDSFDEVLVRGVFDLGTVDISTGKTQIYATVKEPGNIRHPVWLPEEQGVAYLSRDFEANETNLLLGKPGSEPELLLSDVESPLISMDNGRNVAVYSKKDKVMKSVSLDNKEATDAHSALNSLFRSEQVGFEEIPYIAPQPNGDWIAHYSIEGLEFINLETGEKISVELGGDEFNPLWAMDAKWSPNGQKLALIVTEGRFPSSSSDLYILDWPEGNLHRLEDDFVFIHDIAWASDSKHLLLQPSIGNKNGFSIIALYITDVSVSSEILPIPIPIDGLSSGFRGGGLTWSPDGQTILVKYTDDLGPALYQIEVTSQ